jgi:hypothetical protein
MPLPVLSVPKYPITIPSSKKTTFFRPFLMKEQKILFMALESSSPDQMFNAICDIVKSCVMDIEAPATMPMFDLEYLFAKIRSKSVGEYIEVKVKCPHCDKTNDSSIDLESAEVKFPEGISNKVMLTDTLGVILRYPSLKDATRDFDNLTADGVVKFVCDSIDVVFDETSTYTRKDFSDSELLSFVETLNTAQFEKISKFYRNLPYLGKTLECKCSSCQKDFSIDFRGLQDFFT